jgi:hypothetical protein
MRFGGLIVGAGVDGSTPVEVVDVGARRDPAGGGDGAGIERSGPGRPGL